jgi:hypothetical protein
MISISNIVSIGAKKAFKTIWQALNIKYLYHLLYPHMAADFRHQLDCSTCVKLSNSHIHQVICYRCGTLISMTPTTPIVVAPTLGLAQISVDPVSTLPAKIGVLPTVQPFDPTNTVNIGKLNTGTEVNPASEAVEEAAVTTTSASKWFT